MTDKKALLLRLDPKIHDALGKWADDELRSVSGQIDFLLRKSLKDAGRYPDKVDPPKKRGRPPSKPEDKN